MIAADKFTPREWPEKRSKKKKKKKNHAKRRKNKREAEEYHFGRAQSSLAEAQVCHLLITSIN